VVTSERRTRSQIKRFDDGWLSRRPRRRGAAGGLAANATTTTTTATRVTTSPGAKVLHITERPCYVCARRSCLSSVRVWPFRNACDTAPYIRVLYVLSTTKPLIRRHCVRHVHVFRQLLSAAEHRQSGGRHVTGGFFAFFGLTITNCSSVFVHFYSCRVYSQVRHNASS